MDRAIDLGETMRKLLAVILALGLVAAACGDDGGNVLTKTTVASETTDTTSASDTTSATGTGGFESC